MEACFIAASEVKIYICIDEENYCSITFIDVLLFG